MRDFGEAIIAAMHEIDCERDRLFARRADILAYWNERDFESLAEMGVITIRQLADYRANEIRMRAFYCDETAHYRAEV